MRDEDADTKDDDQSQQSENEQQQQLTDKQKKMLMTLKAGLKSGLLDVRHSQRTFTEKATPFMFPDAYQVNQQVFETK